jgi:hypothetical protein
MALGYLVGRSVAERFDSQVSGAVLFLLSILPDFDIFFSSFGVEHGTITHSLTFWFFPVLFAASVFGVKRTLIYSSALFSHFLIGDIALVPTTILWGISSTAPTLGFGVSTLKHALLESSLLIVFLIYLRLNPSEKIALFRSRLTGIVPFGSAVCLAMFMTFIDNEADPSLNPILSYTVPNLILLATNAVFLLFIILAHPTDRVNSVKRTDLVLR